MVKNYNILGKPVIKMLIIQKKKWVHIKIAKVIGKT